MNFFSTTDKVFATLSLNHLVSLNHFANADGCLDGKVDFDNSDNSVLPNSAKSRTWVAEFDNVVEFCHFPDWAELHDATCNCRRFMTSSCFLDVRRCNVGFAHNKRKKYM